VKDQPCILALIPARGGSKSVPHKNIYKLGGYPLIAYTIQVALDASSVTRAVVSTDDKQIAGIAKSFGAEVPFLRPTALSGDDSTDNGFFLHMINWFLEHEGFVPDLIVHLRPTSPFRNTDRIEEAINIMRETPEADALRSVHKTDLTPYKMFEISDGYLHGYFPSHPVREYHNLPRQTFPQAYIANGYVDIIRPEKFLRSGILHGEKIYGFVITEPIVDIDTPADFAKAEIFLSQQKGYVPLIARKD